MKLLRYIGTAVAYLCVGTVLAQGISATTLWQRGLLTKDKFYRILGVVYDIKPPEQKEAEDNDFRYDAASQISLVQMRDAQLSRSLNLDIRESAVEKALNDLRNLETRLKNEGDQYNQRRVAFQKHLDTLRNLSLDQMALNQQQTTEVIDPKTAKELLLRKLDDDGLDRVVTIVKNMPLDKRKKVAAAFRTAEELEKLYLIWDAMGTQSEEEELIRNTQGQLSQRDGK